MDPVENKPTETPVTETTTVQPDPTGTETAQPVTPASDTYELPDGRKLTGEQVRDEYLKLNSEFTRRSQELASLKNPNKPAQQEPQGFAVDSLKGKSEQEIFDAILAESERRVRASLDGDVKAKEAEQARLTAEVEAEIAELKKIDPSVDAEMVCAHAVKYGFQSLKSAHQNMVDFKVAKTTAEKKAVEAMKSRETGVAGPSGASGGDSADQYRNMVEGRDMTARDYLKRIKH